ncbi:MAG: extracellular solute-binding protein [Deltaproteobacteria bacterium]|nr:extracellular solute-binding protein [Deltaproteobacteria bacterium]
MKQFLATAFMTVFSFGLLQFGGNFALAADETKQDEAKQAVSAGEVVVYNWSEYIPHDVLDNFTRETGIKVVYSTYESNEAMYAKVKLLRGKSYDVVVPSTYFIDLMIEDKLLRKLDHSRLQGFDNIDPKLLDQPYDPGNQYSVPYMWGSMGLMINTKYVEPGSVTKWADLLKPEFKGKVMLSDDTRDGMGAALKALGKSANSTKKSELEAAYGFLKKLRASVRVFDITASKQAFVSEEVIVGTSWNGDALVAAEENPALHFIYPEEGAIVWVDSFAITSGAANIDNAYAFINYMLRPEVAKRCMEEYQYSTPNLGALALLDEETLGNRTLNPTEEDLKNSEMLISVGDAQGMYDRYWGRLKTLR